MRILAELEEPLRSMGQILKNLVFVLLLGGTALPVPGSAVPSQSEAAGILLKARTAASEDRHAEAIAFYLEAIKADPALRAVVACEVGHQYTWAYKPDSAIAWYEFFLREHPGDLEAALGLARALAWADRLDEAESSYRELLDGGYGEGDVLLGLARVISWKGRLSESEKLYRKVLDENPQEREAALGLAQVINWSGRHREAARLYARLLEEDPGDGDALAGLAAAEYWMGRPDAALEMIESAKGNEELDKLSREIRRSRAPAFSYGYSRTEDSDDILIDRFSTSFEFSPTLLSRLGGSYAFSNLSQTGYPDIDKDEAAIFLRKRFSSSLSFSATPGYQWHGFDRSALPPGSSWGSGLDLAVWDAYVTLTPVDWVRMDIGSWRGVLDIPISIFKGIKVVSGSFGLDWRLTHSLITFGTLKIFRLSDSNRKLTVSQRLDWMMPLRLPYRWENHFVLSTGYEYFRFKKILAGGYYNPESYLSVFQTVRITSKMSKRASASVTGRFALEREDASGWLSVGAVEGSVSLEPFRRISLHAGYHNSRSRLESRSGYRYSGFFVNVDYSF